MSIFLEGDHCSVHIHEGVVVNALPLSRTCFNAIEGKHIEIGSNSLFSNGIELHTSDYHSVVIKDDPTNRINPAEDIIIGNLVWIGLRTIILKGSTIADNSVVGACSLVSRQFNTPCTLIAGIPAKDIKNNINWNKNKI